MKKYPRGQNLSSWDPIFDHFPPSTNVQSLFLFVCRRSTPFIFSDLLCQIGRIRPWDPSLDLRHEILHRMDESRASDAFMASKYGHFFGFVRLRRRCTCRWLANDPFSAFGADVPVDGSAGCLCAPKRAQSAIFAKLSKAKLRT